MFSSCRCGFLASLLMVVHCFPGSTLAGDRKTDPPPDKIPPGCLAILGSTRFRHGDAITAVAFSADGKTLATAGVRDHLRLWNSATGQKIGDLGDPGCEIRSLAFAPDGKRLACAAGVAVRLWDLGTSKELPLAPGHSDFVKCVAYAPQSKLVATGSADGTLRLWDAVRGMELHRLEGFPGGVSALAFSADGKGLAAGGADDNVVRVMDSASGAEIQRLPLKESGINALAFSADGKWLAVGGRGKKEQLLDPATGKELKTVARRLAPAFMPWLFLPTALCWPRAAAIPSSNSMIWRPAAAFTSSADSRA